MPLSPGVMPDRRNWSEISQMGVESHRSQCQIWTVRISGKFNGDFAASFSRYVTKRAVELDLLCSPAGKRLNDFAGGYPRNFIAIDNGYS